MWFYIKIRQNQQLAFVVMRDVWYGKLVMCGDVRFSGTPSNEWTRLLSRIKSVFQVKKLIQKYIGLWQSAVVGGNQADPPHPPSRYGTNSVKTLRTQDTSDPRHSRTIRLVLKCPESLAVGTSAEVSRGHFGTGVELSSSPANITATIGRTEVSK